MTAVPALVTGGAGGLGHVIVERLASRGPVIVLDVDQERLEHRRSADQPGQVSWHHADITDPDDVQRAVAQAAALHGPPLTLVNCAGIGPVYRDALEVGGHALLRVMQINVAGALNVCAAVVPHMRLAGWGRIVNISSVTAQGGWPGRSEYAASKAALESMSSSLAVELGAAGITVNCVAPGHMRTELTLAGSVPWEAITSRTSLGRLVTPEEVAEAVSYLTSEGAGGVTGSVLTVDSGFLARRLPWPAAAGGGA
jgi:3-oxoacyl-[acyl-carrier protein] reductase